MQRGAAVGQSYGSGRVENSNVQTDTPPAEPTSTPGLEYERFFSRDGIDPFDEVLIGDPHAHHCTPA